MARDGDNSTVQIGTRIPKSLHRAIRADALEAEETLSRWVIEALEAHLKRTAAKPGRDTDE